VTEKHHKRRKTKNADNQEQEKPNKEGSTDKNVTEKHHKRRKTKNADNQEQASENRSRKHSQDNSDKSDSQPEQSNKKSNKEKKSKKEYWRENQEELKSDKKSKEKSDIEENTKEKNKEKRVSQEQPNSKKHRKEKTHNKEENSETKINQEITDNQEETSGTKNKKEKSNSKNDKSYKKKKRTASDKKRTRKKDNDIDINLSDSDSESSKINQEHNYCTTKPFECPICIEDIDIGKGYILEECNHVYCNSCLQGYLNNLIQDAKVLDIHCPHPSCETLLSYNDVKRLCDEKQFVKYEEFTLVAALKGDPNVRWCPNPKSCNNAIVNDRPNENKKLVCDQCHYAFCFDCNEEWHIGTCEELQEWKLQNNQVDKAFVKYTKSSNTQKCPKCKVRIQKSQGCNHMTCTNCSYQFCWLCGSKYSYNHYKLYNPLGCPMMQWKEDYSGNYSNGKRIGLKVLVGAGYVVGGAIAIPLAIPALLIGGPIYGGYRIHQYRLAKKRRRKLPVLRLPEIL